MSQALALDSQPVALELHRLLRDLDPTRWRQSFEQKTRHRIANLEAELSNVLSHGAGAAARIEAEPTLIQRLRDVYLLLREQVPRPDLPSGEQEDAWTGFLRQLQNAYEALSASLRAWSVHVPHLRPINYRRSSFHFLIALVLIVVVQEVLSARLLWLVPLGFASSFWCLELMRRSNVHARAFLLWIFSAIAHPFERYRINSATWFTTGLAILGMFFNPLLCTVGVAVLGAGDPVAALVGRRYGRTKLVGQRSLEGTASFIVAAGAAAFACLTIWHGDLSLGVRLGIALVAATGGAITELFTGPIDDNLSIPLSAAGSGWVALQLLT